jgi:hypothetical protein
MSVYKIVAVTKVAGQPDAKDCCECPDERCLLDCWDAWDAAMDRLRFYRKSHPHDLEEGKKVKVSLALKVTRGNKPHVSHKTDLADFPAAALPQLEKLREQLTAHPVVSKCLVK